MDAKQKERSRNSRRRGRNWKDATRQAKSSVYFLPQHLQEANPWEQADERHDVGSEDDYVHRDAQNSRERYSYLGDHTDDRGGRGNYFRPNYNYDRDRPNYYYDRHRDYGYEDRRGRGGAYKSRHEKDYHDDWGDRESGKSRFSPWKKTNWGKDREFDRHYEERCREGLRDSYTRSPPHSPPRLTREQWRELEREEWLREQERNDRKRGSYRKYYSHSYDYKDDHDDGFEWESNREDGRRNESYYAMNGSRGSAYDGPMGSYAQRRGSHRERFSRNGRFYGEKSRWNGDRDRDDFNTKNDERKRKREGSNAFSHSGNTRDRFMEDKKDRLNSRKHIRKEIDSENRAPFFDELLFNQIANGCNAQLSLQEEEDTIDRNRSALENLSFSESLNFTFVKNSDTESEDEVKSRQDLNDDPLAMPTNTFSSRKAPSEGLEESGAVVLAPKKSPASRKGKQKVILLTNFYELTVQSKVVYRYDVVIYLGTPIDERAIDLMRGARDDSAATERHRLCMKALLYALQFYRIFHENSAMVYDGAAMMFSSEDLASVLKEHSGVLTLSKADLPESIRRLICRVDVSTVTIEITPCRTAAASFNIADLSAQMNRNWATLDRSWKQFYELITNQDAVTSGRFTPFGAGCLYYCSPLPDRVGFGYERFAGARKGIKFIEGRSPEPSKVVIALVLDHRVGMFFKNQNLMKSIRELNGMRNIDSFDFSRINNNKRMNNRWSEVNQYVKGLRMNYLGSGSNPISFIAIGISDVPIRDLKDTLPNRARTEISVLTKFSDTNVPINPNWPAVKRRIRGGAQYFPMELLEVAPHQRVPLEKQLIANSIPRADKPDVRITKIQSLLEALNLHDSGRKNQFLKAFGIKIAPKPKQVEGFRREAPGITFGNNRSTQVDQTKHSWKQERDTKFVVSATADRIIIVHSDESLRLPNDVEASLSTMYRNRKILVKHFEKILIKSGKKFEMEEKLQQVFEKNKGSKKTLIIYIDRAENKSHGFLKLMERKYLIPTQQITAELAEKIRRQGQSCANFVSKTNLKLGGINYEVNPESFAKKRWIAGGKTLIVGYDVAHPGKPSRDEVMNKMPPQNPSVVGFSFNGAEHPECFIGDYHFQTPRREKVDDSVLNARFKWMLDLFMKNRKTWPETVVITRDGVSEGQYRMVIEDELGAIKEACTEFGNIHGRESWMPLFTVVIATKRHNARFFVENGRHIENPQPGTVVDTDVVRNDITEFYMQSHKPVQGTAKPTAYQLIVDENDMGSDELQSLMSALTFHHQIVDAPVSIPEPVYQADEWAKRGKDIWKAYTDRHDLLLMKDRGEYAARPIDFEAMTNRLAYWNTDLQTSRVNA